MCSVVIGISFDYRFWFVGVSTLHTGECIQKLNLIDDSIVEEISIDDLINLPVCQFL